MRRGGGWLGIRYAVLGVAVVGTPGCFGAHIREQVQAQLAAAETISNDLKYQKWDQAVADVEASPQCQAAKGDDSKAVSALPGCLRFRFQAYHGRALSKARAGQFDEAESDELRASEAADGMGAAGAAFFAWEKDNGVPEVSAKIQLDQSAKETDRCRQESADALAGYRGHTPPPGSTAVAAQGLESSDALYTPPDYARWGLTTPTSEALTARNLVNALSAATPSKPGMPSPSDRDLLFQLGRADLNLELALTDPKEKQAAARAALAAFRRGFAGPLKPWEQTETRFLAADVAWRLHDLTWALAFAPVVAAASDIEKADQYNALADILYGDALCEQGGENTGPAANLNYYAATRVGGAAADIARKRRVCGDPNMVMAKLIRLVQTGKRTFLTPFPNSAASTTGGIAGPLAASATVAGWPDLAVSNPGSTSDDRDAALVIGIERYAFVPGVLGAARNATDWYQYLTNHLGISPDRVTLLRDEQGTVEKIQSFAKKAANDVRPGGTLWFVFVGHGAPARDGKDGVLVGADAQQDADGLYARSIPKKQLEQALISGRPHSTVMLIDACFSGRSETGAALAPGLQPLIPVAAAEPPPTDAVIFSAGKSDEFAGPLPGLDRPAFSYLMLGAVMGWADSNHDGQVTAQEAKDYTRQVLVSTLRGRSQTPDLEAHDPGVVLSKHATAQGPDISKMVAGP